VSSKIHRIRYNQPFDLTPEQKGLLASLSRDTGTPIPALLAKALAELQRRSVSGGTPDREEQVRGSAPPRKKSFGHIAEKFFGDLPEDELARLPVDDAAQHDHYLYGLPKRPT
jgi:hypothetical protein